jgi:tetratricopeptide (TPR) repeat protein
MHVNFVFPSRVILSLALLCVASPSPAQTNPANPRDTAFTLEQEGRNQEAESTWESILKTHPADAEAWAHLGFLESRQEHYAKAVRLYRKALALDPAMPGLKMNLGLALFKAGDLRPALTVFEPLYRRLPADSPDAQRLRILIGMAHYGLGEYAPAVPYLKDAMAREPQNLPYRLVLAHSCLRSKQYQCVLDVDREILNLNPESAEADMLTGEALDEMRDHNGAIEQFRAAVKADPKLQGVHFGLGYLLWTQTQYEEAAQQFQQELDNTPSHLQALAYLADSNMRLGRTEAARTLMHKALQLNPRLAMAYLDLGIMDADAGQRDQALREYKTALMLDPADVQVHWRLGRLYQSMGRKEEAKAEFDRTKTLTKAADESVMTKLRSPGKKPSGPAGSPPASASEAPQQ